jgi:pimeloyl-ACP methyl ester carboxylesterase
MKQFLALSLAAAVALAGCVSDDESTPVVPPGNATFKALYAPLGGIFPFPNDLFFSGSADGTVNIPVQDPTDVGDYLVAMNAQDGYSTTAPIFIPFGGPADIDPATVANSDVIILDTTIGAPLVAGTNYSVQVSEAALDGQMNLEIKLLKPLAPKHRFMVIVTRTISDMDGNVAVPDATFQTLLDYHSGVLAVLPPELTAVNGAVDPLLDAAVGLVGVPDAANLVTFSFMTQSTTDVMTQVNTNAVAGAVLGSTLVGPTNLLAAGAPGYATVYQGVITMPYYQSQAAPVSGHWHTGTGAEVTRYTVLAGAPPAATATLNVPILMSVPNATSPGYGAGKPVAGWPVLIFQHGITRNRTDMIAIADQAAAIGFAVVAIDQPLHGLASGPLYLAANERTFNLDVSNNTTRAPGADGIVDASGQNYINLSSLLTSRDNLRESAADLIRVAKTISVIDVDGGGVDLDASRVHFVGHSLGAIIGTTFLGVNTNVQAATLAMPGGTIARLLRDSPTFAPSINSGLASNGVVAGTQLYEQFMQAAQTAVDSGDPINFAAAANANHSIHLIQVVGDGAGNLPDQVVPNSATARLIAAMGISKRSATGAGDGYVNFTAGNHGSILTPCTPTPGCVTAALAAVWTEMQVETRNFAATNGANIVITNATYVEP